MAIGLLVSIAFAADLAGAARLANFAAQPNPPAWVATCETILKQAHGDYRRQGGRGVEMSIDTEIGRDDDRLGECGRHVVDTVQLDVPRRRESELPIYSAYLSVRSGIDPRASTPWQQGQSSRYTSQRYDHGRSAQVYVRDDEVPDGGLFAAIFTKALDQCLALAPAAPAPPAAPTDEELRTRCSHDAPKAPTAACVDAERAADMLEHTCIVEGDAVGYSGRPGVTQPTLARVTALGPAAMGILVRLAHSSNPPARAVAAMGLGRLGTDAARAELRRLATDSEDVDTIAGCVGRRATVRWYARDALAR